MKKIFLIFALAAFTTAIAQENVNTKKESVTTKTAVKDSKGTDVSSKTISTSEEQTIGLEARDVNKTNQSIVMKPVSIDSDVTYGYDGNRFKFLSQKDTKGYRLMTVKDNATQEEYAIIKPTSQNGYYIYSQNGKSSFGYFNEDGNFVVESYDPKTDAIVNQIYILDMKGARELKNNKK